MSRGVNKGNISTQSNSLLFPMFAELFFFQARVVSTQPLLLVYERALDVGQRGLLTDLSHVHLIFFFFLSQSSTPYSTVVHQLTLKLRRSTTVKDQDQQKPSVIRNNDILITGN